jgi:hypothetical protein
VADDELRWKATFSFRSEGFLCGGYESPLGARSFMRLECNAKTSGKSRIFT